MTPYIHRVQYYETDRMGITHHSNYVRIMEEARTDFLERLGWSYKRLEEMGAISPVTSVECRFISPTTYSDEIAVHLRIEHIGGARLVISYRMESGGRTVCEARSEHCFIGKSGRPMRLQRDLPDFVDALEREKEREDS